MSFIIYESRESFAFVRLNRPEKLNALTREMLLELGELFRRIESKRSLRAVILTGAGERAFCTGTDIGELDGMNAEEAQQASKRGQRVCDLIERCRVPVIAAVNGIAAGGGCELALACHLRIAAEHARFSLPEIKLGMIPAYGGTQRLARSVGRAHALELMLTNVGLSAAEAHRSGLVNRVAAPAELLPAAESLANEIARQAPLAVRACLEAVTRGADLPLTEGLKLERELFSQLFNSEDIREGTRAFLEKRAPVFKGK